jgi:hypothetical protein
LNLTLLNLNLEFYEFPSLLRAKILNSITKKYFATSQKVFQQSNLN